MSNISPGNITTGDDLHIPDQENSAISYTSPPSLNDQQDVELGYTSPPSLNDHQDVELGARSKPSVSFSNPVRSRRASSGTMKNKGEVLGSIRRVIQISDPSNQLHCGVRIRTNQGLLGKIEEINNETNMTTIVFEDGSKETRDHDYLKENVMKYDVSFYDEIVEDKLQIPSWSLQDRKIRIEIAPARWKTIFGSNLVIGYIFVGYLIKELYHDPTGNEFRNGVIISSFIVANLFVTLIKAIPGDDTSNAEVNDSVNASILIAMTLYPCLGIWVGCREKNIIGILSWITHEVREYDEWGLLYTFFLWSFSAILLIRNSTYAFTMDRQGVMTGEGDKPITALFRRKPPILEVWSHKITRMITFSLWDITPDKYHPVGGGGRFGFQLIAPVVFVYFYIGYRLVKFAYKEIECILEDTSILGVHDTEMDFSEEKKKQLMKHAIVWLVFCCYCIVIRAVIGTRWFLSSAVSDPETFKHRWVGWAPTLIESKRSRVLWAFRGLTYSLVKLHVGLTNRLTPVYWNDWIAYYLVLTVYISYVFEGIGALFFALSEAERGCHLHTPFKLLTKLFFWCSFNAYLQPFGTLVNALFYLINGEYLMNLRLLEIYSPLFLTERNTFRFNNPFCKRISKIPTKEELDKRLEEWLSTWRRKRTDVGRSTENYVVKDIGNDPFPSFSGSLVFLGGLFPGYDEWLYMRNNFEKYLTFLPWEVEDGALKFNKWYPTYREEVLRLLREPYDFENRREVWMFGYGSLISPNSPPAGLTESQQKQIIPYWLKKQAGYNRAWNYRHGPVGINAFGLEKVTNKEEPSNISGCIYPMDYEKASDLFSIREEGYELLLVHEDYFEPMHKDFVIPKGIGYVWVCGQPTLKCGDQNDPECNIIECKRHNPTQDSPILQSYIDTVVEGALRYSTVGIGHTDGMRFAASILSSTVGWDAPWVNDRLVAGRPWSFMAKYELIDGMLSTCSNSRNGFVNRLRVANQPLKEKRNMLQKEGDKNEEWAISFYGQKKD